MLLAFSAGMYVNQIVASSNGRSTKVLDVEIYPRDIKLCVGETQLFQLIVRNGSAPFSYRWYSNGTLIGFEATVDFGFTEPCNYIILSVTVTDSVGLIGVDSVLVYDPTEILIEPVSYVTEASYVVSEDGTTTYMRNGTSGEIPWESTDSSAILQACIGNLTSGGIIFIKQGDYTLTATLTVTTSGIIFRGEGDSYDATTGTTLRLANNVNGDIIDFSGTIMGCGVYQIHFEGTRSQQTAGHAIHLTNTDFTRIIDCGFNQVKDAAIFIDTGCQVIWVERCQMMNIEVNWGAYGAITIFGSDCVVSRNTVTSFKHGIYDGSGFNEIIDNQVYLCTNMGIYLYGATGDDVSGNRCNTNEQSGIAVYASTNNTINDNRCLDNDQAVSGTDGGIRLWGPSTYNTLTGNSCWDRQGTPTQTYGIILSAGADNNEVLANNVQNNKLGGMSVSGANNEISHNIGFVTENYISSTNTTATTFVFNHDLAGTPDFVFCSFNTTAITGYSWTATSTQITVTVTGSGLPEIMACYCEAIYES